MLYITQNYYSKKNVIGDCEWQPELKKIWQNTTTKKEKNMAEGKQETSTFFSKKLEVFVG